MESGANNENSKMSKMRAKMVVEHVQHPLCDGGAEILSFRAVAKSEAYPADGNDEDNSFARWSPSATCQITVANPALIGKFTVGEKYYVDFTSAG